MREYATRQLNSDTLFSLKFIHHAKISPDREKIAYVVSETQAHSDADENSIIVIVSTENERRHVLPFSGSASCPHWSPDGNWIAFLGETQGDSRLYIAETKTLRSRALSPDRVQVQPELCWSPDSKSIAFTTLEVSKPEGVRRITKKIFRQEEFGIVDDLNYSIQLVNIGTGATEKITGAPANSLQPVFHPSGKSLLFLGAAAAVSDAALVGGLKLFISHLDNGEISEILGAGWCIASASWTPNGKKIVLAGDFGSRLMVPMARLWVLNPDGSNAQCRTDPMLGNVGFRGHHDMPTWKSSQDNAFVASSDKYAYASISREGRTEIGKVSLEGPLNYETVAGGNRTCLIMDGNSEQVLFCASDIHRPWELCIAGVGSDERSLTNLNGPVMESWPRLEVTPLKFTSSDGMAIEAWSVARADRQGPQPTVLFIHGGPMLSVGHFFRFDFHLLAANGYSVVFANFRGSVGYGEAFMQAIVGDWGARGFPDHMGTVDAAIVAGISDPERLGVWGPSHGGFATCWIVGHTDRFRAAVAEACAVNEFTMYYLMDSPDLKLKDFGGRPDELPDVYRSRSPIYYAARCKTPTLLIHGEEDLRCPIAEAEQFYRALHDANCTTELVRVPDMTHMGDSVGPLFCRLAQNEALLDWWERFL